MLTPINCRLLIKPLSPVFRVLLVCLIIIATDCFAADETSPAPDSAEPVTDFEGLSFIGPYGIEGEDDPGEDTFTFEDGLFTSKTCLQWGFAATPYWTKRTSDGLHFLVKLESPEHGTMYYEGVFDGREMNARALWKKERWYRTIERTYVFKGRLLGPRKR